MRRHTPGLLTALLSLLSLMAGNAAHSANPASADVHAAVAPPPCWTPAATRVLIAYVSDSGHTAQLAADVGAGASSVAHSCVWLLKADGAPVDMLPGADAIILGSPVHNGNPAAPLLQWLERWPFQGAPLRNKPGAAFVTAGGISAGEETTQLALLHALLEFGMVVVGGADWQAAFGASAIVAGETPFAGADIAPHFRSKARELGRRVALLAQQLQRGRHLDLP